MAENRKKSKKESSGKKKHVFALPLLLIIFILAGLYIFIVYRNAKSVLNPKDYGSRSATQQVYLEQTLDIRYPERNSLSLSSLEYGLEMPDLDIKAHSAIMIDTVTGSIVYEKNADDPIPPASLTKIVEMYVIFQAVENGEVSLSDIVPLPPQSWSVNLPSDASRMYLGKDQRVTLRELLLGLAIASGNDASIACAYYICGNMQDFVDRMNSAVEDIGLKKTHFVESSGYSEKNVTTAREFATFARHYIQKYPFALSQFHSKDQLRYPLMRNLSDAEKMSGRVFTITQPNTNKLLGLIKGCDGLKTGFIDESGYNISVTARSDNTRFLSVTMGGPGSNTQEGNKYRIEDNLALFNYAFGNFADYQPKSASVSHEFTVGLAGCKEKTVRLVPALNEVFTVPFIASDSPTGAAASVYVNAEIPDCICGSVKCGDQYGVLYYKLDDKVLRAVPLVADRDVERGNAFDYVTGVLTYNAIRYSKKAYVKYMDLKKSKASKKSNDSSAAENSTDETI